ncbi:hypothetical protein PUN28_018313 [Cardiocondyla obscurior]|uniref:Uncharacterized protein n=1 Tax=Cardiocondyla obscurior TaxID=286306 RepID=A0AAW2EIZ8_9HYME
MTFRESRDTIYETAKLQAPRTYREATKSRAFPRVQWSPHSAGNKSDRARRPRSTPPREQREQNAMNFRGRIKSRIAQIKRFAIIKA